MLKEYSQQERALGTTVGDKARTNKGKPFTRRVPEVDREKTSLLAFVKLIFAKFTQQSARGRPLVANLF